MVPKSGPRNDRKRSSNLARCCSTRYSTTGVSEHLQADLSCFRARPDSHRIEHPPEVGHHRFLARTVAREEQPTGLVLREVVLQNLGLLRPECHEAVLRTGLGTPLATMTTTATYALSLWPPGAGSYSCRTEPAGDGSDEASGVRRRDPCCPPNST